MITPKIIGERSAAQVLAKFLAAGMCVTIPFGDSARYDLVVDENGDFIRVQCKTGCLSKDGKSFVFPTASNNWKTYKRTNYIGQADIFAIYLRETRTIYIFNINNCPKKNSCTVRLQMTRQKRGIRFHAPHKFKQKRSLREYP